MGHGVGVVLRPLSSTSLSSSSMSPSLFEVFDARRCPAEALTELCDPGSDVVSSVLLTRMNVYLGTTPSNGILDQ